MKLSVIIPVYKVEATLDRCVESVLRQHVNDMEVILVDDGSPDNCPEMCDDWAKKDAHIRVIHKKKGGLSDARNAALDIATGDYITFDSDDWISPGTYEPLLEMMGDNDLLEYAVSGRLQLKDARYENTNEYWLQTQVYTHCFAWNKIFRRHLFDGVRFPKGRIFEDVYTYLNCFIEPRRCALLPVDFITIQTTHKVLPPRQAAKDSPSYWRHTYTAICPSTTATTCIW